MGPMAKLTRGKLYIFQLLAYFAVTVGPQYNNHLGPCFTKNIEIIIKVQPLLTCLHKICIEQY